MIVPGETECCRKPRGEISLLKPMCENPGPEGCEFQIICSCSPTPANFLQLPKLVVAHGKVSGFYTNHKSNEQATRRHGKGVSMQEYQIYGFESQCEASWRQNRKKNRLRTVSVKRRGKVGRAKIQPDGNPDVS